jgi:hypothetical protein
MKKDLTLRVSKTQEAESLAESMRGKNRSNFLPSIIRRRKEKQRAKEITVLSTEENPRGKSVIKYCKRKLVDVVCLSLAASTARFELTELDRLLIIELRLDSALRKHAALSHRERGSNVR